MLDVGCGTGEPVSRWLMEQGFAVSGVDFSEAMLTAARSRFPMGDWRLGDMRTLDLKVRFNGIVGWDSFFHLTPDEQRQCLPKLSSHLVVGGTLLFTVGPDAGEIEGTVGADKVYHASLSPAEYAAILEQCGLRLTTFLAEDPDAGGRTILMACKQQRIGRD